MIPEDRCNWLGEMSGFIERDAMTQVLNQWSRHKWEQEVMQAPKPQGLWSNTLLHYLQLSSYIYFLPEAMCRVKKGRFLHHVTSNNFHIFPHFPEGFSPSLALLVAKSHTSNLHPWQETEYLWWRYYKTSWVRLETLCSLPVYFPLFQPRKLIRI